MEKRQRLPKSFRKNPNSIIKSSSHAMQSRPIEGSPSNAHLHQTHLIPTPFSLFISSPALHRFKCRKRGKIRTRPSPQKWGCSRFVFKQQTHQFLFENWRRRGRTRPVPTKCRVLDCSDLGLFSKWVSERGVGSVLGDA